MNALKVDPIGGINSETLSSRTQYFGSNYKEPPTRSKFWKLLLAALDDFLLKLLIVASVVQIVIDLSFAEADELATAWIEGFGILMAVAIVSLVTAWSDYQKEAQFLK